MHEIPPYDRAPILIVDHDEAFRDALSERLGAEGYPVVTASSAPQALEAAFRRPPSVALMDISLPGVDGVQLLRYFRSRHVLRKIPVIILSRTIPKRSFFRILRLGVPDVFIKSDLSVRELVERIEFRLSTPQPTVRNPEIGPSPLPMRIVSSSVAETDEASVHFSPRSPPPGHPHGTPSDEMIAAFGKLRALPRVVEDILRVAADPGSSLESLQGIVRGDPVLAMRILRRANAKSHLLGAPVAHLDDAVRILGFETIAKIASSGAILRPEDLEGPHGEDLTAIWKHCLAAAVFAERMSAPEEKASSYLAGLLHGLPAFFGIQYLGSAWPSWRRRADTQERPLHSILSEALDCPIEDLCKELLSAYRIPSEVAKPIQEYHEAFLAEHPHEPNRRARRLDLAHHLAMAAGRSGTSLSCVRPILADEIRSLDAFDLLRPDDILDFSAQELQSGLGSDLPFPRNRSISINFWRDPRWAAPDPVESVLSMVCECRRVERIEQVVQDGCARLVMTEPGTPEWGRLAELSPALILHRAPLPDWDVPEGADFCRVPVSLSTLGHHLDRLVHRHSPTAG
jgi:CheY-like chemotaxis protein/HD-like signal output (HDOD) protein